jgi:hypothetical protein
MYCLYLQCRRVFACSLHLVGYCIGLLFDPEGILLRNVCEISPDNTGPHTRYNSTFFYERRLWQMFFVVTMATQLSFHFPIYASTAQNSDREKKNGSWNFNRLHVVNPPLNTKAWFFECSLPMYACNRRLASPVRRILCVFSMCEFRCVACEYKHYISKRWGLSRGLIT